MKYVLYKHIESQFIKRDEEEASVEKKAHVIAWDCASGTFMLGPFQFPNSFAPSSPTWQFRELNRHSCLRSVTIGLDAITRESNPGGGPSGR
ncbi:hypothetical protein FRC03_003058 [Tulasnella sp. 419]|nr:hypothetical protein FRC03_003058 [Tulasnella sp. 419]